MSNSAGDLDNATQIEGATDGTKIGNDGDASKSSGYALEYTGYSPNPSSYPGPISQVSMDYSDQTMVRGQVLTDEASFRDDFSGTTLTKTLTGTVGFTSGSYDVTGTGTAFTSEIQGDQYIKKSADAESLYVQVDYLTDDENLVLSEPYAGTTAGATAVVSNWKTAVNGAGSSLNVANSVLSLTVGGGINKYAGIFRAADYLPYNLAAKFSVSTRSTAQTIAFGFQDDQAVPTKQACFIFDGTVNTTVKCRSASSAAAADIQDTTIILPQGNTSTTHYYRIDVTATGVNFTIDDVVVAVHSDHIPGPYDLLGIGCYLNNTGGAATAATVALDWVYLSNQNQVEVTNGFKEPFLTKPYQYAATYSAASTGIASATLATDIFTLTGSATKQVRVTRIHIDGTQTTTGTINVLLLKRSTANSGGTSATVAAVPHDSASAAATAVARSYTANPTLGTLVGAVRSDKVLIGSTTTAGDEMVYDFGGSSLTQAIVLRGTAEVLAVNLNATTATGGSFNISMEWIEE